MKRQTDQPQMESGAAQPQPKRRRARRSFWQWMFLIFALSIMLGGAVSTAVVLAIVRSLPPIQELEYYEPEEVTRIYDRTGTQSIGDLKDKNRVVVSIDKIPHRLRDAFLAIEDSRFYTHIGVDWIGIIRAFKTNYEAGRKKEGASTITQQLARNILPEDKLGTARNYQRKINEALLAMQIERRYSKDQILEFYLNTIFLGSNAYGVQAAASTYFSKRLDELTLAECATLAGIPKAPSDYNPADPKKRSRAVDRRDVILRRMRDLDLIDEQQFDEAVAEPLTIRRGDRTNDLFPYFQDALERDLRAFYGKDLNYLKKAGLRITTTLDTEVQRACVDALSKGLPSAERMWQESKEARHGEEEKNWDGIVREGETRLFKITALKGDSVSVQLDDWRGTIPMPDYIPYWEPAAVLKNEGWLDVKITDVDRSRMRITGVFGDDKPIQGAAVVLDARTAEVLALVGGGAPFYDQRLGFYNRALMGGRQVGSGIKPLFYAAGLSKGMQPNSIIVDEPVEYNNYKPRNYEKVFFGPTTLIEALEHSRNIATLRLFEALGVKRGIEYVSHFDFIGDTPHWDLKPELSTCLGACDATPLEMASAYQVFANLGVGIRPTFFRSILSREGRIEIPRKWKEVVVIEDPINAAQMQYMLRQVVLSGTGQGPIGDKFPSPPYPPVCGKTGTTNDNRDAWFIGFTPDLVIAVQVGFDTPKPMGPRMTGGRVAGPIWAAAFSGILKTREHWQMKFETPPGIAYADVASETGKRASRLSTMYDGKVFSRVPFARGKEPVVADNGVIDQPVIAPIGAEYRDWAARAPYHGFASVPAAAEWENPADYNWFE